MTIPRQPKGHASTLQRNSGVQRIGIVGSGPTAVYTLKALLAGARPGALDITLFEAGPVAGVGTPFDPQRTTPSMLANIASIELPPVCDTLRDWVRRRPTVQLAEWGIADDASDERAFFPRIVLGAYYIDQLRQLARAASGAGHRVHVRTETRVTDIIARPAGAVLRWIGRGPGATGPGAGHRDGQGEGVFDQIVVATGYQAPRLSADGGTRAMGAYDRVVTPVGRRIGILGSSLSAIDAAVAQALRFGRFERQDGVLRFIGETPAGPRLTMLSRGGLLPEADFYFPAPAEPLDLFTPQAIVPLVQGRDGDLDRVFALFVRQLARLDPIYARDLDLQAATADDFATRYFARRRAADPFDWARRDLAIARESHATGTAIPWRYAILRMHEVFGQIVPRLSPADLTRFQGGLKRCFVDNYAAVPHLSIERLLALHDAGVLSLRPLGEAYTLAHQGGAWRLGEAGEACVFDTMIDARGQQALGLDEFPFPTLRLQLCAQALAQGDATDDGLPVEPGYAAHGQDPALARIHCPTLPFLLKRNPFIQGLSESAAMGRETAAAILAAADVPLAKAPPARASVRALIDELDATVPVYGGDAGGIILLPRMPHGTGTGAAGSEGTGTPPIH